MDPVQCFAELEIPKEVSFLISDFVYGWRKCNRCKVMYHRSLFYSRSNLTKNCFRCRQKSKPSLEQRWLKNISRREGELVNTDSICTRRYTWASQTITACDHKTCSFLMYHALVDHFEYVIGFGHLDAEEKHALHDVLEPDEVQHDGDMRTLSETGYYYVREK